MLWVNPPRLNTIDHTDEAGSNYLRPGTVVQREQTDIHAHAVNGARSVTCPPGETESSRA